MLKVNLTDEEYEDLLNNFLLALTKDAEQTIPQNLTLKQKRWLLDGLMEVRASGDLDETLLKMQDKLLSYENQKRGVKDISTLKFQHGEACVDDLTNINADVCLLFSNELIPSTENMGEVERKIILGAGLQLKEEWACILQEYHNVLPKNKAYVAGAHNLAYKFIVKIIVGDNQANNSHDYKKFEQAVENLKAFMVENKFKTLAIDMKSLQDVDEVLFETLNKEIKVFKKNKLKIIKNI